MASATETKTYDRLVSSTFENNEELQDQIHKSTALLAYAKEKGRIKTVSGGERIAVPLMYGLNSTIKSMSKTGQIDVTPQDGITKAFFNWKYITGSCVIWTADLMMNKGNKEKIFDIMEAAKEQLVLSVAQEVTSQLFSDGTGNGSLDITGLQAIAANDPSTGTLGGINRANEAWWRNAYNGRFKDAVFLDKSMVKGGLPRAGDVAKNPLSRKYYRQIAGALKESQAGDDVVSKIVQYLKSNNPRFNADRFMQAAGKNIQKGALKSPVNIKANALINKGMAKEAAKRGAGAAGKALGKLGGAAKFGLKGMTGLGVLLMLNDMAGAAGLSPEEEAEAMKSGYFKQ